MIENTEQTDQLTEEAQLTESMSDYKKRIMAAKGGEAPTKQAENKPSEPVVETPKSEIAETSEVSDKPIQETGEEDSEVKGRTDLRTRFKQLVASGRTDLAEKLIADNASMHLRKQLKLERETREKAEKELQEHRTRKPAEAAPDKEKSKPAEDDPKPVPGDEPFADYLEKLADWKANQRYKSERAKEREESDKRSAETKAAEQQKTVSERLSKFKATKSDWDEKMAQVDHITSINKGVGTVLIHSEMTGELRYYLADHPEEFEAINAMPEAQAYDEMRGLEGFLKRQSKESPKPPEKRVMPISKAAPPAKVVTGGASETDSDDPDESGISLKEMKIRLLKRGRRAS